jgi:hypothetical protein
MIEFEGIIVPNEGVVKKYVKSFYRIHKKNINRWRI